MDAESPEVQAKLKIIHEHTNNAAEATPVSVTRELHQAGVRAVGEEETHKETQEALHNTGAQVVGEFTPVPQNPSLKVVPPQLSETPPQEGLFQKFVHKIKDFIREFKQDKWGEHRFRGQYEIDISEAQAAQAHLSHEKSSGKDNVVELFPSKGELAA